MLDLPNSQTLHRVQLVVTRLAAQHDIAAAIGPADHLVDVGFTSMAMVELMLAVEAEFDVSIPQREMTPTNFQAIETLAQMLDRIAKA